MSWCFAIVNNKLAEIYFDETKKDPKIWAHCYIKKVDFKTKEEKGWIEKDTANSTLFTETENIDALNLSLIRANRRIRN